VPGTDLSGSILEDRYQVIEPIAEGAMGAVYRGERLKLGRAVAIKIMHDALPDELASRQRFEREAKLMARLEHPHCVSVIDFGLHDGKPFLVMDLVRGTSLLDILDKAGRIEPARAAEITRQILSGLAHAHELGIVHRDIKPANIMLTERTGMGEQVRILDFGLARPALDSTKLTTGIVVGTPNYMAPEQIKGGAIDGRTDLYAVGVLLYELLTGVKPFIADDPLAVVRKHLHAAPPTLAQGAPGIAFGELEDVIGKALAKAPAHRFASAAEMSGAIDQAITRRASLAETMARAVPQRGPSSGPLPAQIDPSVPKIATESGWNLPAGPGSGPAMSGPNAGYPPAPMSGPGSGPAMSGPNAGYPPAPMFGPGSGPASSGSPDGYPPGTMTGPNSGSVHVQVQTSGPGSGSPPAPMTGPGSGPAVMSGPNSGPVPMSGPNAGYPPAPMTGPGSGPNSGYPPPVMTGPGSGPNSGYPPVMTGPGSGPNSGYPPTVMTGPGSGPAVSGPGSGPSVSGPGSGPPLMSGPNSGPIPMSGPSSGPTRLADPSFDPANDMANAVDPQAHTDLALGALPPDGVPPTRRRTVPPTRINTKDVPPTRILPLRGIPLSRNQLLLAGGGLALVVIILIAVAKSGGSSSAKPVAAAGSAQLHADASSTDPVAPALSRASDLYANGDLEPALDVVLKARRQHPESAQLAFLAGKIYFAKLWWTDGIKSFRDAIRLDPAYRSDPELVKIAIRGFITTPDSDSRIEEFLQKDLGDAVKDALEETSKSHPSAAIRARAAAELRRFH